MESSSECWRRKIPSDSVPDLEEATIMKSAKSQNQNQVRGTEGRRVAVYVDVDHMNENRSNYSEEEEDEERELRDEDVDEDEDGVHGGRMKPLSSFDVNSPSHRRRFRFRNSPTDVDELLNRAAGVKQARRPRDKVNSSSAPRLTTLNDCKENNGGLLPLCPGKIHIRGMKPKNSSPKASGHLGISRTFGKKRSRLKSTDGDENEDDVKVGLSSTDNWQRGGMDLLLMVLDSDFVQAEGPPQSQETTQVLSRSEVNKRESNERKSLFSTDKVLDSRKFPKFPSNEGRILPYFRNSSPKLPEKMSEGARLDETGEDSEGTADDPRISCRKTSDRWRQSLSPPKRVDTEEGPDTESESCPRECPRTSRMALSPKAYLLIKKPASACNYGGSRVSDVTEMPWKYVQIRGINENDGDETCAHEAESWTNFEDEVTVELVDLGAPLHVSRGLRSANFSRVLQHDRAGNYSAEKRNTVCFDGSANRLSNSNFLMEKTNPGQERRDSFRSESSSSLRVFHEPSLIIAHDIRPSLIQPVKIVGRFNHCMVSNSDTGMGISPVEVDVCVSEAMEESQAREHTNHESAFQRSKKRKTSDHVSAFRAVKIPTATSVDTCRDRTHSAVDMPSCSGSAFQKFEDSAHFQNRATMKIQVRKILPCTDSWWGKTEDTPVQGQTGRQQKIVHRSSNLRPTACQNLDPGLSDIPIPSHFASKEDGNLSLGISTRMMMLEKERFDSRLHHLNNNDDEEFNPTIDEVTIAQCAQPVQAVRDSITDDHRELSSTVSHTLQSGAHLFRTSNPPPLEPSEATGFHTGDLGVKAFAPVGKKRRRNLPLVASHFQDNQQAKVFLPNPWFESSESQGECAVQVSAGANTSVGSYKVGIEMKYRRRMGPRNFQPGRPRTKLPAEGSGNYSNYNESNSSLDQRSATMVLSGATCKSIASCEVTGGKIIKQRRGYKRAQLESLKSKRSMSMARKFKRLSEPSGFLGEFNPGIIQRVRNSKQILAHLEALVGEANCTIGNKTSTKTSKEVSEIVSLEDSNSCPQEGRNGDSNVNPMDVKPHHHSGLTSIEETENPFYRGSLHEDRRGISTVPNSCGVGAEESDGARPLSQYKVHDDDNSLETEGLPPDTWTGDVQSFHCPVPDDLRPSTSLKSVDQSLNQGKSHLESLDFYNFNPSKPEHPDTELHDSSNLDLNNNRRARAFTQPPAPAPTSAPAEGSGLAAQWLELLTLDIKGRLSALKRSRRRVRTLLVSGQLGYAKAAPVDYLAREELRAPETLSDAGECVTWVSEQSAIDQWRAMFTNMDGVLCMEAAKLESNLWQIQQMVVLCQDPNHFLVTAPSLPIVPDFLPGKENCPPSRLAFSTETKVPAVAIAASAASILSTASFLTES